MEFFKGFYQACKLIFDVVFSELNWEAFGFICGVFTFATVISLIVFMLTFNLKF